MPGTEDVNQGLKDAQHMRLVSFDPLRTMDIPNVHGIKPTDWFREKETIQAADWVLFPEYWQVNPLVYAWKKRIFPSANTYHMGHDKIEMMRAFEAICPQHIPYTLILPATELSTERILDELSFPFVAKEIRSANGQGVFLIEDRRDWEAYAHRVDVFFAQEYLPIHRDLRVVFVAGQCVFAYWREGGDGYFHNNVSRGGRINHTDIPQAALTLVQEVASELGIDHAGFDVADLDGHFYFLEFNLRFGTHALNEKRIRLGPMILQYLQAHTPAPVHPTHPFLPKAC